MEAKLKVHLYQSLVCMSLAQNLTPSASYLFLVGPLPCRAPGAHPCACSIPADASRSPLSPAGFTWLCHTFLKECKTTAEKVQTKRSCHIRVLEELIPVWEVLQCAKELLYLCKRNALGSCQQCQRRRISHPSLI